MTDEELKKEFKKIANLLTFTFVLLVLFVCITFALAVRQTHSLICSAENPPRACKE